LGNVTIIKPGWVTNHPSKRQDDTDTTHFDFEIARNYL
jgi:hypothetical protein